ncbi:hypothetical protein EON64_14730, partial [archaeon]
MSLRFHRVCRTSELARLFNIKQPLLARSLTAFGSHHHQNADVIRKMSIEDPVKFWSEAAKDIVWIQPPSQILEIGKHGYGKWFKGGILNTSYNCLDRHIEDGLGSNLALVYDSPVTNTVRKFTYQQLHEQVCRAASVLRNLGIEKGDRVVIYMPNIPEAVISMLACARVGAVHSVVFGGFAAPELATRIKDCQPKLVIASSCGIDGQKLIDYKTLLDSALQIVGPSVQGIKTLI